MAAQHPHTLPGKSVLSLAIASLLLGHGAQAATITVNSLLDDGTNCTLREAIQSINLQVLQDGCTNDVADPFGTNDTILFGALVTGTITLNGTQLGITRSVSIEGPGAANLTVDGAATSRVFNITGPGVAVATDGLTIRGGSAPGGNGGGIQVTNATLALSNSTVSGNSAMWGGGLFARDSSVVTLTNSTVSDNSATNFGGGLYASESSVLTLNNSTVSGNAATLGGGLSARDSSVALSSSTVSGNSASVSGGALFARESSVTLTDSTVSGNSAGQFGGGLYASYSSVLALTNSTVSGNSANQGGGLSANGSSVTLTDSTVSDNSSNNFGGGLHTRSSSVVTLTDSTVSGNSAQFGGALYASESSVVTLNNSTVSGNSAGMFGGGIDARVSSVTLTNSTVSGNSAGSYDGGGLNAVSSTVTLTDSTVSGNSATSGGGLSARDSSVALGNSTVSSNSATSGSGGGLRVHYSSSMTLTNSTVSGNSALVGAGLFSFTSSVTLTNTLLAGNNNTDCNSPDSSVTGSFNLIGDAGSACGLIGADNNIIGVDPLIGPLADNGCVTEAGNPNGPAEFYGCVRTHALLPGSPALNAANADEAPGTDQRAVTRPQGSGVDIGAFESDLEPGGVTPDPPTDVSVTPVARGLLVSWIQPEQTGLSPLASCTATADPEGASCSVPAGEQQQCTIPDLDPEVAYTVTVACTNEDEVPGLPSTPSEPVNPLDDPEDPLDPPEPRPVPVLSFWGLLAASGLLGLLGAWQRRRLGG